MKPCPIPPAYRKELVQWLRDCACERLAQCESLEHHSARMLDVAAELRLANRIENAQLLEAQDGQRRT